SRDDAIRFEFIKVFGNMRTPGDITPPIQAMIDAVFATPGAEETVVRSATSMLVTNPVFKNADRGFKRSWNRIISGPRSGDLLKIFAGIEYLRPINGEKHMVVLTNGLPVGHLTYLPKGF